MFRRRNDKMREFRKWVRTLDDLSPRDQWRIRAASRFNREAVEEQLDEFLADPEGTLRALHDVYGARCSDCAAHVNAMALKVAAGEVDWEEFFQSLAEFLEVILPIILEVLANC